MRTTTESCPRCGDDLEVNTAGLDQLVRCPACSSAFRALYDAEFDGLWRGHWTLYPLRQPSGMERVRGIVDRVLETLRGGAR
jgi:DNA-directed RNA polymerase subunit RPC12/RpoP